MVINLSTIEARLHLRRRNESETAQFGRDARSDWQVVFLVFALLNMLLFAFSVTVYQRINRGEIFLVPKQEPASFRVLNRIELKEAAEFLEKKKASLELLQRTPFVIPGPGARPAPKR